MDFDFREAAIWALSVIGAVGIFLIFGFLAFEMWTQFAISTVILALIAFALGGLIND